MAAAKEDKPKDNTDLLKQVEEMVDLKVSEVQTKVDELTAENAKLKAELEAKKEIAKPVSSEPETKQELVIDPNIPKVEDKKQLKNWHVKLKGSTSQYVVAENQFVAQTLYNKYMGIKTTENQHEVVEVTKAQLEELKEKDQKFCFRPIHRDTHNQVVRERETAGQFDVAS